MSVETAEQESNIQSVAKVRGQAVTALPKDLYIPPDALEIILEAFEGPLDLLLYLIKKENLDILDIPIAEITRQYIQYIELMDVLRLELAAEYLVMAAMLAEIKSRILLPRPTESEEEEDPRAELIRRLQEYERFKKAAEDLDSMPRLERDIYPTFVESDNIPRVRPLPTIQMQELLMALNEVLTRAKLYTHHHIRRESLSIRERMTQVLSIVNKNAFTSFDALFNVEEGRAGIVVTFIAILELLKQAIIEIVQAQPYAPIHVRALN